MFQESFEGVSRKIEGVFQETLKVDSRELQGYLKEAQRLFGSFIFKEV